MKRWKQVCSTMLAGTMLFQTPVVAAPKEEKEEKSPWVSDWKPEDGTTTGDAYQIYPVPQNIQYPSKTEFGNKFAAPCWRELCCSRLR